MFQNTVELQLHKNNTTNVFMVAGFISQSPLCYWVMNESL